MSKAKSGKLSSRTQRLVNGDYGKELLGEIIVLNRTILHFQFYRMEALEPEHINIFHVHSS